MTKEVPEQFNKLEEGKKMEGKIYEEREWERLVPPQYRGMRSEIVEELWAPKVYVDAEKNKQEAERREKALEYLRKQELGYEEAAEGAFKQAYADLSAEEKDEFPRAQKEVVEEITNSIEYTEKHGEGIMVLPDKSLSEEEQRKQYDEILKRRLRPWMQKWIGNKEEIVLIKIREAYHEFKKQNPDKPFVAKFDKEIDKKIYNNLVNYLALGVLAEKTEKQRHLKDQEEMNKIREKLDLPQQEIKKEKKVKEEEITLYKNINERALDEAKRLIDRRIEKNTGKPQIQEGLRNLYENLKGNKNKTEISAILLGELYHEQRSANYPFNEGYREAWNFAVADKTLSSKTENDWVYRGLLPSREKGEVTVGRASLNINVTPETVRDIDRLIKEGTIKANYKFGDPETAASVADRHDAVTIYFLEKPNQEALEALGGIAKKYYRGENLVGRKISEGFYISEVGSVSDMQTKEFLAEIKTKDPELESSIRSFLTNKKGRIAMSEGQYDAVKKTLNLYNFDIHYDQNKGIIISEVENQKK